MVFWHNSAHSGKPTIWLRQLWHGMKKGLTADMQLQPPHNVGRNNKQVFANAKIGRTRRQTDGGTKHPADWRDRNRRRCGGGHGGEVRKKLEKKKENPGRQYVPVLWEEPCCASQPLRCLAQHQSMWSDIGCLAHHPVTLFLLWQPQGLTAWLLLRKRDGMRKRGELQPLFVVSAEEISDVKQLKLLLRTQTKISFPRVSEARRW